MVVDLRALAAEVLHRAAVGPGTRVCCALSGGMDSIVLLDVLCALQPSLGFQLSAVHVHHGLSPNADDWLAFCERVCAARGVAFQAVCVKVPAGDRDGLEGAARRQRHAVFDRQDCDWIALGHHRDDQAETVLFRLFRGTGVRGAAAMAEIDARPLRQPGRLRPLLAAGRPQLVEHAHVAGLSWVDDESNADCRFVRNRIRHRILPEIEQAFPAASVSLGRAAAHFREAAGLLDDLAELDACACRGDPNLDDGVRGWRRSALLALTDSRLLNLLMWQIQRHGMLPLSTARMLEAVRQFREVGEQRPFRLPLGELVWHAYRDQAWLEALVSDLPVPQSWQGLPGAHLPWGGGHVVFKRAQGQGIDERHFLAANECRLDLRPPGLRLQPAAGRPRRSFKNLCQEAAVPDWLRARLPVLTIDGQVVWVGGIGADQGFACPPGCAGVLPVWHAQA